MTNRINISCLTTLGLLLAASPSLVSQVTTGSVVGRVTDGNGNPIAGARVILTAPQLMGQREITADANGEWRASLLPVGDYTIRFSASGYIGSTISNIRVGIGSAIRQDRVLRPVGVATETVDIVGTADNTIVDKTDTRTAVNYSSAQMQQLTGAFRVQDVRNFSTGVARVGEASVRGGATTGNTYRLNGVEIREGEWGQGWQNDYMVADMIEDMAAVLSPANARYGRATSSIEIATKSGGNSFSGTVRWTNNRNNWGANRSSSYRDPFTNLLNNTNQVNDNLGNRNLEFTLTGPVIKDRLWFTMSTRRSPGGSATTRLFWDYNNTNQDFRTVRAVTTGDASGTWAQANYIWHQEINQLTDLIVGTHPITERPYPTLNRDTAWGGLAGYDFPAWEYGLPFDNSREESFYTAKLTWQITQNHRLSFEGHDRHDKDSADQSTRWRRREQVSGGDMANWSWRLDYNGVLGPSTLLEFKLGRMVINNYWGRGDTSIYPWSNINLNYQRNNNLTTPTAAGTQPGSLFAAAMGPADRNNASGSLNLTMYRDFFNLRHHIDTGIDYWQVDLGGSAAENSVVIGGFFENPSATGMNKWLIPVLRKTGPYEYGAGSNGAGGLIPTRTDNIGSGGTYDSTSTAFYLNDQMTINDNWNLMLGLRYEKFEGNDVDGRTILSSSVFTPRLTVTYDPKGDSSHVFKFNYINISQEFLPGLVYQVGRTTRGSATLSSHWMGYNIPGFGMSGMGQPAPGTLGDIDPAYGQEMYGLRFITIDQLMDFGNFDVVSFTDTAQTHWGMEDLKPQGNTEVSVEYRRNYGRGSYFRTAYIYRWFYDVIARKSNYDPSYMIPRRDPRYDTWGTSEEATPHMYHRQYVFNDSSLWRDYHGFELETVTAINSVFRLNLNYTYSQSRGNTYTGEGSPTGNFGSQGNFSMNTPRYNQSLFHERRGTPMSELDPAGALYTDIPHIVNAALTATLPVMRGGWIAYVLRGQYTSGSNFGLSNGYQMTPEERAYMLAVQQEYMAASGNPNYVSATFGRFNPLGAEYGTNIGSPPTSWTKWHSARGAYHQGDTWSLNFTMNWEIPIYKKIRTMGTLNINNVLNSPYYPDYNRNTGEHLTPTSGNYEMNGLRYGNNFNYGTVPTSFNGKSGYRSANLTMGLKF
ncbi:MAG: TonB-dependent receptor [Holophagaceae bacterium]|nr:TonB-dependent receptor [Holophagaceae bacterium]